MRKATEDTILSWRRLDPGVAAEISVFIFRRTLLFSCYAAGLSLFLTIFDILPRLTRSGPVLLMPKDYSNLAFTLVLAAYGVGVWQIRRERLSAERFGPLIAAGFILLLAIQGNILLLMTTTIPMPEVYLIMIFLGTAGGVPLPATIMHPLLTAATVTAIALINLNPEGHLMPHLSSLILAAAATIGMAINLSNFRNLRGMIASRRELEEIRQRQDSFFAILAHDLRNPIGTLPKLVDLFTDELEENGGIPPQRQELLEAISTTALNTSHMLEDLLNWGEYRAGIGGRDHRTIVLPDLISGVLNTFSPLFRQRALVVDTSFAPVPPVYTGAEQLRTILRNIIGNAVKYSPPRGRIRVALAMRSAAAVELAVEDEGVGMETAQAELLKNGKPVTSRTGTLGETGTGLGMSLVHRLLREIRAEMEIESTPGKGTRFAILLPADPGPPIDKPRNP